MSERVKVTLIKKHGIQLPGEETECHPNMVPILIARGIIEAVETVIDAVAKKQESKEVKPKTPKATAKSKAKTK